MPRATKDAKLDSAAARGRLEERRKPYYRLIEPGLHVGYYRGANGGSWIGRRYVGAGSYATGRLGLADDGRAADGREVLTFAQAQSAAREWATVQARKAAGIEVQETWTVEKAVEHYMGDYRARGGKVAKDVDGTFRAHVLPRLGSKRLDALTPSIIKTWHRGLATAPARLRTSLRADKQKVRVERAGDVDAGRARRATANRVLTALKAALNLAYREGHVATDDPWRRVQPFQKVDAARIRYLSDQEATRLVNAAPSDLAALVTAALLTGCRYQELARLTPADIDGAAGVLTVRETKSGAPRTVVLTDEAVRFFSRAALGKKASACLFPREDGDAWGKSHQFRPLRVACAAAAIVPAASFHVLRHTHASRLAMRGVPMAVIAAQLGHSDVKVTGKHYAHLSPGYIADTVRQAFGDLGFAPVDTKVTSMR